MALKTGKEYLESTAGLGLEAHILGRQPADLTEHGLVEPSRRAVAFTYDGAHHPETRDLFCVESPLSGEADFSGTLVERFASYHRQSYGDCKVGVGDVLIGATALIARLNGAAEAGHIKDKIVEMIHLNETIYACGLACSA